jgi:Leucine-rich repeat (LRR) protein
MVEERVAPPRNICNLSFLSLATVPEGRIDFASGKLRHLFLNSNRLTTLPESIGRLVNLWQLFVFDNELVRLPDSLGRLRALHELDCSNNRLTEPVCGARTHESCLGRVGAALLCWCCVGCC